MSSAPAQLPPAVPWAECPTIRLDLGKPHNARYANVPADAIHRARALLQVLRNELPPGLRRLAPLLRLRTFNRFHREIVSLARIVNADWRDVMLANISYELVLAAFGCSTAALSTPSGPVLARNMDWWPEDVLARASFLVRFERNGQMQFCTAGWPGAVGVVTGLSGRGLPWLSTP
jgi:hypothetical protein